MNGENQNVQRLKAWFAGPVSDVLIDADDTLWYDSRFFRSLRVALQDACVGQPAANIDVSARLGELLESAFGGERGYASAVREVAREAGVTAHHLNGLETAIEEFLSHPIELLPGVRTALKEMYRYRLTLVTKGSIKEQSAKLSRSLISEHFHDVRVVRSKSVHTLRLVLRELGIEPDQAMMIGNSVEHDVIPAVLNGLLAVWINHSENSHGRNAALPAAACEVDGWAPIVTALRAVNESKE